MYFFSAVSMFTKTRLSIVPLLFCSKRINTLYIITLYSHRWQCGISMTSFPISQTAVRSGVYMLSIMFEFLLFLYFSLSVVFIHILFNMWISHKRINNKSLLQILSFLLNSENSTTHSLVLSLISCLVKKIYNRVDILAFCCVVNKQFI